ncbi:MAG: alpha-amylase family glycosyl hydrolase [Bacteroidota bacterium]
MKRFLFLLVALSAATSIAVQAQTVSITFGVNMNYLIEQGVFNPAGAQLDLAGTFNGWGNTLDQLTDSDGDGIYTKTIGGFTVGTTIQFKFRRNGAWDGTEEFPGGGSNRVYTVQSGANELEYWYNDELPPNSPAQASFFTDIRSVYSNAIVGFQNTSAGDVTGVKWLFEGGVPSTSTQSNPMVQYATPGTYDVTLIAMNANGSDTLTITNFIEVKARNTSDVSWWNETVFYEIFVRSFFDSDGDGIGDFNGITQKLDYLNDGNPDTDDDLGITGIWLMPIHDSPSYHGYDVTDYRSIHPDYGTMEDFQNFLDAAHARGIRVIIDFVMNHSSTEHPWFQSAVNSFDSPFRDWYRWSANDPGISGPWGQQVWHNSPTGYYYGLFWGGMPDLDYSNPDLKAEMFDAADFWLDEIGIDGFRLDAVKYIFEDGNTLENTQTTLDFWNEFRTHYKATKPDAFTVGEAWSSTPQVVPYVEEDRLDYCFEFDLAGTILYTVNEGVSTDILRQQIQQVYNVYPHLEWGTFLTNHDQDRVKDIFGDNLNKNRTAAAIYLTLPGVPYLYYGEEVGMNGTKPDPNIRRPMQWSTAQHAGFSTSVPWQQLNPNYPLYNVAAMEGNDNSLLNWYKKLIHVRNAEPALNKGEYYSMIPNSDKVLCFVRTYGNNEQVVVIINNSEQNLTNLYFEPEFQSLPGSVTVRLEDLLEEANTIEQLPISFDGSFGLSELEGRGVRVFKVSTVTNVDAPSAEHTIQVFPNPASDEIRINDAGKPLPAQYQLLDAQGRLVQSGTFEATQLSATLDVSQQARGVYFLQLIGKNTRQTIKIIKQ